MKKLFLLVPLLFLLAGCEELSSQQMDQETQAQIVATDNQEIIEVQAPELQTTTLQHTIHRFNTDFQIQTSYGIQKNRVNNWIFTASNKIELNLKPVQMDNAKFQIIVNNLYSDVTTLSNYIRYNGVRQDSLNLNYNELEHGGITVTEQNPYSMPFQVEGINQNATSVQIINGYGYSTTDRITESQLRNNTQGAVLTSVWTIFIKDKTTGETAMVPIEDNIGLPIARPKEEETDDSE